MKIVQIGGAGHAFYAYDSIKRHGFDFAALSCGSCGIDTEGTRNTLAAIEKRGFTPKLYDDYKKMADAEKPDIAIVNPQFSENAPIAEYLIKKGINVFCEKPLANTTEQLDRLEFALRGGDADLMYSSKKRKPSTPGKLGAMFGIRYEPGFRTVKKAIDDGRIGEIRLMDSRKSYKLGTRPDFFKSRETYCGIIPWVAIHAIDWMRWLSGEHYTNVTAAHSSHSNFGNGDMDITSSAQFMMTNEVIAAVTADMLRPASAPTHGDDRVRVVGTKGVIELESGIVTLINGEAAGVQTLQNEPAADIFDDFLDMLEGKENGLDSEGAIESTRWALAARDYADMMNPFGRRGE